MLKGSTVVSLCAPLIEKTYVLLRLTFKSLDYMLLHIYKMMLNMVSCTFLCVSMGMCAESICEVKDPPQTQLEKGL